MLYLFCLDLKTNSDYFSVQHLLTGFFYNRGRKCLLRGTNWVFKSRSYSFVLKSLIFVISVTMLIFFLFTLNRVNSKWLSGSYTIQSRCNPMWFISMGLRQRSGLCSSYSHKYPGTEGTNENRHWNHHRWHATNSLKRTGLSCWCL